MDMELRQACPVQYWQSCYMASVHVSRFFCLSGTLACPSHQLLAQVALAAVLLVLVEVMAVMLEMLAV